MACDYFYQGKWYTEGQLKDLYNNMKVTGARSMVFLRHAITNEDTEGKNSGQNDEKINQEGIEETVKEVTNLATQGVNTIYTSPTLRAVETSNILGERTGLQVTKVPGLAAWDLGIYNSKPEKAFHERFYVENPNIRPTGGETFGEFKQRFLDAVDTIYKDNPNGAILTHSKGLKIIRALEKTNGVWNQQAINEYFKEATPGNPQINHFNYRPQDQRSTIPTAASKATLAKIKEFLDRIGANVQTVSQISVNGRVLGINGIAFPLEGLVQVVSGKEDIALPEEAMHLAVDLIEQTDPKLFNDMMNRIGRYKLFEQVISEYQNNPFYQTKEGRPDVRKIKKEAIGKVLAETVINKNQDTTETPNLLDQTRNWWQKIIDFLKGLFLKAQFNPFEVAASKVLNKEDIGDVSSLTGTPFASRNPAAVNASMKLVQSLRDPRAQKWFDSLYKKGQKDVFFMKLQQDLQAPKGQVDLLKKWINSKEPQNVGDMIAGILAELSYTVQIEVMTKAETAEDHGYLETGAPPGGRHQVPTTYYSGLNVKGGTNYRENEIKTPGIRPVIKGHAAFSTDEGIGWFRSDDKIVTYGGAPIEFSSQEEYEYNKEQGFVDGPIINGRPTQVKPIQDKKTRRIIEIQSDLFQKSRPRWNEQLQGWTIGSETFATKEGAEMAARIKSTAPQVSNYNAFGLPLTKYINALIEQGLPTDVVVRGVIEDFPGTDAEALYFTYPDFRPEFAGDEAPRPRTTIDEVIFQLNEMGAIADSQNNFLNLLAEENTWVTFFVKAIIQDSAKRGYESVRFPGGSTANKIEGQTTIEEYVAGKQESIRLLRNSIEESKIAVNFDDFTSEAGIGYYTQRGKYYTTFGEGEAIIMDKDDYTIEYQREQDLRNNYAKDFEREIEQLEKEIADAQGPQGLGKFGAIARFYENTVQNILKKQGYKPVEVTDEYGNKWFEVAIDQKRDQGEFYFQVSGTADLAERIVQKDANISKNSQGQFEINGNRIKNTVQKEVEDYYKQRLGTNAASDFFKHYKRETESKVQVDIKDIISRRVDDNGIIRQTPLTQINPSAVDPNDNTYYQTLDSHIEQRLSTYPPGTKFINAPNLFDGTSTAATPDLIAILPTGQVDILMFKAAESTRAAGDIATYIQQGYNIEIEAIRRVLEKGYGVRKENFRYTRAIPIRVEYNNIGPGFPQVLAKMTVGNVNIDLIQDDLLLPIPSKSETSGNKKFDSYIQRLRALAQKIGSERVPPDKRLERTQRVAALTAAIRKLQIKKDATALITSAQAIIKAQKDKYTKLVDKISNTDPAVATIAELNKIAEDILSDKDQVQIYEDMYDVFKKVLDDGTVDSQDAISEAREISDDARDITNQYYDLSITFRTQKFAAKLGIRDEFDPEKKITWYRRMIRSLSQSPLKAGAELWELVKRINNKSKLQFLERLDELEKIKKRADAWLKGKDINELYKRIFSYDAQGRWTGRMIHKFSKQFYTDVKEAQRNKDIKWVKDNIDVPAYMAWFVAEHQKMIDNSKTARIVPDDAENARLVQQQLQDFVDNFHIDFKKGVGENNYKLKDYPLESKWKSDAYRELEAAGNEPLLDLYKYYEKRLDESWRSGMFQEYVGWDWFPNVRRNLLEKLSTAKTGGKMASLLGSVRIEAEDSAFGKIDPISGKPIDEVHALFIRDLGKMVEESPNSYFMDYSEKSMDIFRVLALWDLEIIKFQLKTESEGIARLLYYTEAHPQRKAYETTPTGKLARSEETNQPIEISNEVNAAYIKEHIDAVYYGKQQSNEFDVTITVGDTKLSGVKLIETMNRYFVTKTLGVNVMTSFAQLFGGTLNVLINQGRYFNKKDIGDAELKLVTGNFWANEADKKLAGLIGFINPFLEDRSSQDIRELSVSGWVKYLSSDHLFYLQRKADTNINKVVGTAMIENTMVIDGKLVNMREQARKELRHEDKYSGTYEQAKEFEVALEKKVDEYKKSPQALINYAQIVNDKIVLPGIERTSDTVIGLRQQTLEIIKDALGNTSHDDLALYKRNIMWKSFFMFKNWIPRMLDVRMQSFKYSPGTQKYEYGRIRMLWNAVRGLGLKNTASLIAKLGNDPKPLIEVAKEQYEKKKSTAMEEKDEFNISEAEFVDMYIKGVRSEIRELMLALGLFGILIAARAMAPEGDDDPEIKGMYRWSLRALDKLTDELTFMYTPSSFTSILNGSVFPAVGILVEIEKLLRDAFLKVFYYTIGDTEAADRKKVSKHLFKLLPVTKELMTYVAMFNDDIAKEYGIRVNTYYGSAR